MASRSRISLRPVARRSASRARRLRAISPVTACSPRQYSAALPERPRRGSEQKSGGCAACCRPYPPHGGTLMSRVARKIETDAIADRVAALDWERIGADLDAHGCATTGALLSPDECTAIASRYDEGAPYRSRVIMARHGFGRGEYKYF